MSLHTGIKNANMKIEVFLNNVISLESRQENVLCNMSREYIYTEKK